MSATASAADHIMHHAEAECRERGLQLTPLRRRVLGELVAAGMPLGAYDLVDRIGRERRIAPISVYRVLDFLIEAGLIHRIATQNTYLPCHHDHADPDATVFLVCSRCGGVNEVNAPEMLSVLAGTAAASGFLPGGRALEVEGECAGCRDGRTATPRGSDQAVLSA